MKYKITFIFQHQAELLLKDFEFSESDIKCREDVDRIWKVGAEKAARYQGRHGAVTSIHQITLWKKSNFGRWVEKRSQNASKP